jgi:hypothetical protein
MAQHYRNGGPPPGSIEAPLLPNDYNASSGETYSPSQNENPTQFGVYGNLPPSNAQSTGPYSNATGVTDYTAASYYITNTIPPTPPPKSPSTLPQHS